ncbi:MAG: DUF4040 domain-containing protein [Pirellulaceae bacterium]|nr:DUF4040 domain-containing protein [Pirellulaceae bacterium]
MDSSLAWFDAILTLTLVVVALRVLFAQDLFQAIVLFIVFGLLLSLAWCRLGAVDVALAEAAIGAGLTGALFLNTLATTRRHGDQAPPAETIDRKGAWVDDKLPTLRPRPSTPWTGRLAFGLVAGSVTAWMAAVVVPLAVSSDAPRIAIDEAMLRSGVTNPVTAVLLNFRAYDTLLEVAVLMLAVLTVSSLTAGSARVSKALPSGPVLTSFVRLILPVVVMVAVYVLWSGTKAPGGAFQAAALLGAGGVLLLVTDTQSPSCARYLRRVLLVAGLAVFLLVGLGGMLGAGRFLEYPPAWAGVLITLVETVLTVSIALVLVMLFVGTSPTGAEGSARASDETPGATPLVSRERTS